MLRPAVCVWAVLLSLVLVSLSQGVCADGPSVPSALQEYVAKPDYSFAWKLAGKTDQALGTIYDVELTSQTWQGIVWKHVFLVYEPKALRHHEHALLFISGGKDLNKPKPEEQQLGLLLATMAGARVAMLHQVPNQPLLGNRVEDDLITETLLKYLETGDKSWPLLFPMVKSAVRAMDAVEQIGRDQHWKSPVRSFVVTGASKRGWTTWLSAAADPRVVGIAPMVIDTLNFQKQMDYQLETWGKYSEQIHDYESKGLIRRMRDEQTDPLWQWLDPHTYRARLTLPKLIINGTNDRYWTVDALNNYWDDLAGPKFVHYVPNAGHNLRNPHGGREAALATLAAFFDHVVAKRPLPALDWKHADGDGGFRLTMTSQPQPLSVRLWTAGSSTKDFRDSQWESQTLTATPSGEFVGKLSKPAGGHVALFGDAQFRTPSGTIFTLCTQIRRE
jgi:PhoPQ-activated pathogenicity-related protein